MAALAVQQGYLTPAGLHQLIRSIVVDAFLVLVVPMAENSPVAAIRFTSTRTYWTEMFPRLDIGSIRQEATRRAERIAQYGLAPTTAVALRDLRQPSVVLTREQWAVASQIMENASARDLALRQGTALADMTECLGRLARAGVCGPVRVRAHRQLAPAVAAAPAQERPAARRLAPVQAADRLGSGPGGAEQPPTADILRQVLNGLRKLS